MARRFEHHARTVSALTLISRVTGLARDASLSRVFGAGPLMDAFFFAFIIPNLFRRLFGEGALAAAFLPVYSELERDDPQVARQLASLVVSRMVVTLGGIVLLGEIILYFISASQAHSNIAVWLMMIMLPYMPLVCLVAILGAMLHVHGRFGPTAAAPIVLNVCVIASAIGFHFGLDGGGVERETASAVDARVLHIGLVSGAVILAGLLQVAWSMWALRNRSWWTGKRDKAREPWRRVLTQAGPMILGLGVLQLNTFFDGVIASYPTTFGSTVFGFDYPLGRGAMSAVSYAQRLYQFPLGAFGIAIATAIFPALSRLSDDEEGFTATLQRGLRLVLFIGLPASVGLILVRGPLAAVIFQGGQFTIDDSQRVAFVLIGYAPAVWAYSMMHVFTRAFYARGDSKTPVRIAASVVILNLILNVVLIWTPLRESGLAWSTAICSVVQVFALGVLVRRQTRQLLSREVTAGWIRTVIITGVMTGVVLIVLSLMNGAVQSWTGSLVRLAAAVGVGVVIYVAGAVTLRMPEWRWALGRAE